MGAKNALPKKIPRPSRMQRKALEDLGITVEDTSANYCKYSLPKSWSMVDNSQDANDTISKAYKNYQIVDERGIVRVNFTPMQDSSGGWLRYHKSLMDIEVLTEDEEILYTPRKLKD